MDKIAFLKCLDWANVRWPNLNFNKKIISSLYEDYKGFSEVALANALGLIYQNGAQFLDLPKLYKLTKEQNDLIYTDNKQLPRPIYKDGLKQYLKDNNFKTLNEAIKYNQNKKEIMTKKETIRVNYDIPTFTIVPHWVADILKPTELATYVVLGKYADNVTKECWPSLNTIAKDLGRSKPATITAIKGLQAKGVLKIDKRRNDSGDWARNHYTLMVNGGSKENLTTPSKDNITTGSKENNTRGSKENVTLTRPITTRPIELYNKKIQNSYKDKIVEVCSLQKITQNQWGQIERTAKQLFEAGVTLDEITILAKNIVLTYGEATLTHRSLVNHTELIQGAKTRKPKDFKNTNTKIELERGGLMSNKGALAVTNLIDEIPGMSGLIFDKEVIPENDLGYGGLSFKVGNELKYIEYDLFLNFKDLYDLTIGGTDTLENQFIGNVYNLFNWLTQIHYKKAT